MDKKIAKEFVDKVSPLEHSDSPKDRNIAKQYENRLSDINKTIPEPEGKPLRQVRND